MRKLIFLVLLSFGAYKGYEYFMLPSVAAFDDSGQALTLVFTYEGCGAPCADAVALLKQRKITFTEHLVTNNSDAEKLFRSYGGKRFMPYVVSGNQTKTGFQRDEMIGFLAEVHGSSVLTRQENYLMRHHFDKAGQPLVVMYSKPNCGYCTKAIQLFNDKGVAYIDRDIKKDRAAGRDFKALKGQGTPLVYVGYRRINGYNKKALIEAFELL